MKGPNGFVGCLPKDRGFTHQVRTLLRSVWDEDHVNAWLLREQRGLDGASVVAAIADDRYAEVTKLVMVVLSDYAVTVVALDPPSPLRSVSERMPA